MDLSGKHKVMPTGIIEWGTTPKDFFERKTAMMWTTTGNLTNVKNNAKFEFGVAMLPAGKRRGSPTAGGHFPVLQKSTSPQQAPSLPFIKAHPAARALGRSRRAVPRSPRAPTCGSAARRRAQPRRPGAARPPPPAPPPAPLGLY